MKDRKTTPKERVNPTHPVQPLNLDVTFVFDSTLNAFDIRWEDPELQCGNQGFSILGVNLYRSYDSEYGPYFRLNTLPIGANFWRDVTTNTEVVNEDVSQSFLAKGSTDDESGRWIFRVENYPIVKPLSEAVVAESPDDVEVTIDGVSVRPLRVYGPTGEVELRGDRYHDPAANKVVDSLVPRPDSVVLCTYRHNTNLVTNELARRVFYRVTTVGTSKWDGSLLETPLEWTDAKTIDHIENMDYIWREGIRRNSWILDQGGERVKLFLRKWHGVLCSCWDATYKRPQSDCDVCYGTSFEGGYEGPYEIKVGPTDAQKRVSLDQYGFHMEQVYEVWTGPSPMLSQRDFIVKQNNDRFTIGPVNMPSNRGNVLQQHFQIDIMDENDIRYKVPVAGPLPYPETRVLGWDADQTQNTYPQITEDATVPDQIEERGRTPTYENINSGS